MLAQGSHRHRHGHVAFEKLVHAEQKPDKVPEHEGVEDVLALVRAETKVYAEARRQKKTREEKMLADYYRRAETRAQEILQVSNALQSMHPCEWQSTLAILWSLVFKPKLAWLSFQRTASSRSSLMLGRRDIGQCLLIHPCGTATGEAPAATKRGHAFVEASISQRGT